MAAASQPSAADPPVTAAANSVRPVDAPGVAITLREREARRCEYSSWRNSSATPIRTLESEPMPNRPPAAMKRGSVEHAVAEIGLGDRAEPGHRAGMRPWMQSRPASCASRGSGTSARRPARDRAATRPAARRTRRGSPRPPSPARRHGCGSARQPASATTPASSSGVTARRLCGATPTSASGRPATAARLASSSRAIAIEIVDEAALARRRRRAAEAGVGVEHRQQGQADAGRARRPRCAPPSRRVGIGPAVRDRGADSGTRRRG